MITITYLHTNIICILKLKPSQSYYWHCTLRKALWFLNIEDPSLRLMMMLVDEEVESLDDDKYISEPSSDDSTSSDIAMVDQEADKNDDTSIPTVSKRSRTAKTTNHIWIWPLLMIGIFGSISLKHDHVKNQNKAAALCIVGFIGGSAER